NQLVDRFFEARKMMASMSGGMGGPGGTRKSKGKKSKGRKAKGKKGKKTGRGPTPPKVKGGMPGGMPGGGMPGGGMPGMPDLSGMPKGLDRMPPGLEGVDLSQLELPDEAGSSGKDGKEGKDGKDGKDGK